MTTPSPDRFSAVRTGAAVILIAALALLVYANTFTTPFVFDDLPNITENPHVRMTAANLDSVLDVLKSPCPNRPIANLTVALNYYFHGYDVRGYHALNLLIHVITALLVLLVGRQTLRFCGTKSILVPTLAAALWMVSPVHTQSVTYIVQRMNSMAAMFFMLAMFFYIQARMQPHTGRGHVRRMIFFSICRTAGLCGLASKELTATLPIILFLYEWYFFQNCDPAWIRKRLRWIVLTMAVCLLPAAVFLGSSPLEEILKSYQKHDFTPGQRLLTEPAVIVYYINLLLFPHPGRLVISYDFPLSRTPIDPLSTASAITALFALLLASIYSAKRHRLFSFTILWFLVTLSVESSFIGLALIFEHRTYLPSIFPLIALTTLTARYIRPKAAAVTLLCAAVAVSGLWTYRRNSIWHDNLAFWRDAAAKSPGLAIPYINIGIIHKDAGEIDRAMECYTRAWQQSKPWQDTSVIALSDIGELLLMRNRFQEAADCFQQAIAAAPEFKNAHINLGIAMMRMGRTDDAIKSNLRALEIDPYLDKAFNNLGYAWFKKGDAARALHFLKQTLAVNPHHPEALDNIAIIEKMVGKYGSIIDQLKAAAQQEPENTQLSYETGQISQTAGMTDQAIYWYEKALALEPERALYLNALGNAYADAGRIADAAGIFEKLAGLMSNKATVLYNLACLYARLNEKEKSVEKLREAVENGYNNWGHLKTDKDLENISDTAYYQSLLNR
jgi:tetratricopeptide (TPR) repeat protein